MCNTEKSQKENSKQLDNARNDVILESTPYGKIYMKFVKTLILISFLLIPVVSYGVDSDVELNVLGLPRGKYLKGHRLPYEVRERFGSVHPRVDGFCEEVRDEIELSYYHYMMFFNENKYRELIENNPQLGLAKGYETTFIGIVRGCIRILFIPSIIALIVGIFYAPALCRKFDGMITGLFKRNA